MKKVVALALAAVLLFCLAIPVFADESEEITAEIVGYSDARVVKKDFTDVPSMTEYALAEDAQRQEMTEIKISTPDELKAFGARGETFSFKTVYLANDIDMTDVIYQPAGGAHAEGSTTPFRGTFDGQGYEIKNLEIDVAATQHIALIANAQGATIRNVIIGEGSKIMGTTNRVGAIVGAVTGEGGDDITTIDNCWNKAAVSSSGSFVGGIVGFVYVTGLNAWSKTDGQVTQTMVNEYVKTAKCIVKNCTNSGSVTVKGSGRDVGGIVGGAQINMEITNCRNAGTITGVGENATKGVGGIIGRIESQATDKSSLISGCINNGDVNPGKTVAGGILGCARSTGTVINNCKNYGTIAASTTTEAATNGIWGAETQVKLTNATGEGNWGTTEKADDPTLELALKADTLIVGTPVSSGDNDNNDNNNNNDNNDQNQGTNSGDNKPQQTDAPETTGDTTDNGKKSGCASSLSAGLALIGCLTLAGGMLLRKKK